MKNLRHHLLSLIEASVATSDVQSEIITALNQNKVSPYFDYQEHNDKIKKLLFRNVKLDFEGFEVLVNFDSLDELRLTNTELSRIPPAIYKLVKLSKLELSNNRIHRISDEIGQLNQLEVLNLNHNTIVKLPNEMEDLLSLRELSITNNKLSELNEAVCKLPCLKKLILDNNTIQQFPENIGKLATLTKLSARSNELEETLPSSIYNLNDLETLLLSNNQLEAFPIIPKDTTVFPKLKVLDLAHNRFSNFPETIYKMGELHQLNLSNNKLSSIEDKIGNLKRLIDFDLEHNQLTALPETICTLTKLTTLSLGNNKLASLPAQIIELNELDELQLKDNCIKELPEEFGKFEQLVILDLANNQLTLEGIPRSFKLLHNKLKTLQFSGNSDLKLIPEVLYQQPNQIIDYIFALKENEIKNLNEGKIVVLRDGAIGKTALVSYLIEQPMPDEEKKYDINIRRWKLNDLDVTMNVWELGKRVPTEIHQFFVTPRSLYILVCEYETDSITNLYETIDMIVASDKDAPILVVMTAKTINERIPACEEKIRKISTLLPQAHEKDIYKVVIKENQREGVDSLKQRIYDLIEKDPKLKHIYDPLPQKYLEIKNQLLHKRDRPYSDIKEYYALLKDTTENKEGLLRLLVDLGYVYRFENTIVYDIEWLTNNIYLIFNMDNIEDGRLSKNELRQIIKSAHEDEDFNCILGALISLNLAFKYNNEEDAILIPKLRRTLREESPLEKGFQVEYKYKLLTPSTIMPDLMMEFDKEDKKDLWKYGFTLSNFKNTTVRFKANDRRELLTIFVRSNHDEDRISALNIVREKVEKVNAKYRNESPVFSIVENGRAFPVDVLRMIAEKKIYADKKLSLIYDNKDLNPTVEENLETINEAELQAIETKRKISNIDIDISLLEDKKKELESSRNQIKDILNNDLLKIGLRIYLLIFVCAVLLVIVFQFNADPMIGIGATFIAIIVGIWEKYSRLKGADSNSQLEKWLINLYNFCHKQNDNNKYVFFSNQYLQRRLRTKDLNEIQGEIKLLATQLAEKKSEKQSKEAHLRKLSTTNQ